jgi:hypothetical protein
MRDRLLDRYQPLERVLSVDDFNEGFCGWQTLFPDYDGWEDYPGKHPDIDSLARSVELTLAGGQRVDRRLPLGLRAAPMLSSLTSWDIGSQGSWNGHYALKIPTLACAGDKGVVVKRLTSPWRGRFRIETWFCFKAEHPDFRLGQTAIRSVMLCCDVMDAEGQTAAGSARWWPAMRYWNAEEGRLIGRWQIQTRGSGGVFDGPWTDLEDGAQRLAFNRSPTKYQWHYLRLTFDLGSHTYVDFHCSGRDFAVAGLRHEPEPPLPGYRGSTDRCWGLVAVCFAVETGEDRRSFLFLDSVVVSADQGAAA